jgi:hypothetical protein
VPDFCIDVGQLRTRTGYFKIVGKDQIENNGSLALVIPQVLPLI